MTKIFDNRLNSILKNEVTPLLNKNKFKKRQLTYVSDFDGFSWLLDIQKSQWNDQDEVQFTINCGVYVPDVLSVYANMSEPTKPKVEHCVCSARIGMLMPERRDIWWKITSNDSYSVDGRIAQDLKCKIENVILPFLNNLNSPESIANFLCSDLSDEFSYVAPITKAQRLAYSAIIYSNLGNASNAKQILDAAIESAKKTPIEDIVCNLTLKI